jgi:copper transport protein
MRLLIRSLLCISNIFVLLIVSSNHYRVAAHSDLVRSEPEDGAILDSPPISVHLWFEYELDTFESQISVLDVNGNQVDLHDAEVNPEDRTELRISLPEDLPPGEYFVHWTAVDDTDAHPIQGEFSFTVKETVATPASQSGTTTITLIIALGIILIFSLGFIRRRSKRH